MTQPEPVCDLLLFTLEELDEAMNKSKAGSGTKELLNAYICDAFEQLSYGNNLGFRENLGRALDISDTRELCSMIRANLALAETYRKQDNIPHIDSLFQVAEKGIPKKHFVKMQRIGGALYQRLFYPINTSLSTAYINSFLDKSKRCYANMCDRDVRDVVTDTNITILQYCEDKLPDAREIFTELRFVHDQYVVPYINAVWANIHNMAQGDKKADYSECENWLEEASKIVQTSSLVAKFDLEDIIFWQCILALSKSGKSNPYFSTKPCVLAPGENVAIHILPHAPESKFKTVLINGTPRYYPRLEGLVFNDTSLDIDCDANGEIIFIPEK